MGPLLREWRRLRRLSQLELALRADSSARHVSYVETGKALPSRAMVLRLAEALEVPLRERNALLLAAGYAPAYQERGLDDDSMASVRAALDMMLSTHEPYPAVVVDRWWNVVAGNAAMPLLMDGIADHLQTPTPNVYRLALHPEGLAARILNLHEIRGHFLHRLHQQARATGDLALKELYEEVSHYPLPAGWERMTATDTEPVLDPLATGPIQVPLRMRTPLGDLSFFSTMATFGAPADVTLSELAIELFYPLDDFTAKTLRSLAAPAD